MTHTSTPAHTCTAVVLINNTVTPPKTKRKVDNYSEMIRKMKHLRELMMTEGNYLWVEERWMNKGELL